jgi:transposase-like protein
MKKIPPSERISNEISELLSGGSSNSEDFLSTLIRKSVRKIIQETLEQEIADYLGRGYYERTPEAKSGYRNGYENRALKTAEGRIEIDVPQLRDTEEPYRSSLLREIKSMTPELERLAIEMYVRGLSTRDIEETLKGPDGRTLISKDGVSDITEALSEEYERFCSRDLSGFDVVYLFVDGVYESLRLELGAKEAVLCAWAILSNGRKVLLHLALGNKESYNCWQQFFRDLLSRGLRMPLLVVSDGAPGLIRAIEECLPRSKRQRCLVHKLRNIANKLPRSSHDELMPKIKNVYYQTNHEVAMMCATQIIDEFAKKYPSAINCFQDDLKSCLNHIDFPAGHHKHIRTTNLIERAFAEQKRRTKVIPRFLDEKSCLKLVFATLIRVSDKWRSVSMSEYDLTLLKNIRTLYGWKTVDGDNFISLKMAA